MNRSLCKYMVVQTRLELRKIVRVVELCSVKNIEARDMEVL